MRVRRYSGATPEPTEDPDRKGLYYHPVGDNIFALSFLPEAPPHRDSATVIGLIPSDKGLDSFRENQLFIDLLQNTIKSALIEGADEELAKDATRRQEGWIHVQDWRNFPELGRVGSPDDILGSVLVQNGKVYLSTP
ncbi:hypothetical protein CTheo_3211 [Ceratobasidium theobromae]|uniref:Uncharacterized protein n=1 Tax=Ceratobasidium theobromae TaxID=1582974 RepID=A0A5N5QP02_9AGAM|nr:hypothetical protein CTheo_3211 [Ceratobasidium theobromae]